MFSFLNQLSIRNRIWAIVALLIGSIVLGSVIDILMLREALWHEREHKTRQLVESGFGVLTYLHEQQQKGELSEAAAQAAAIGTIKAMRYDEKEYFWLNDLGTPFPKMIMHPTVSTLDGELLDGEQFNVATGLRAGSTGAFTPTDGRKNLFVAFTEVLNQSGAGYVTYTWPKPRAGAAATEERYAKLSYIKKFEPWGWVIGSGIYVDDVDTAVLQLAQRNALLVAGVGIVLLFFAALMARSITQPLHQTITRMRAIGLGDDGFSQRLPVAGCSEIAELAGGFNEMLEHLATRDAELARHREFLEEEVARRTAELQDSNLQLAHELAEHRQAEQAMHESEERFSSICATAQDAIIMLDKQCHISYWNTAAEKIFGLRHDQALGRDLNDLLASEQLQEAFKSGFEPFRLSGEGPAIGKTLELVGRRQDGSEFPMELSISGVHMRGNWSAIGFVRDISERKRTEQLTRESRGRIRALLDASDESVMLLDPAGTILAINAFAARRFSQVPKEMTGQNFFDLMPPDLAASRRAVIEHVATTGEPMHTQDRRGAIFFDNNIYPVMDESGKVESIAIYAKDVTDQHRARAVEDIFRHLDTVLLKWQMNLESIAQIFCDDILPVFDLPAAWVGRAEKDGRLTLLATAEGTPKGFLDPLRESKLRWDGEPTCCLPTGAVIRSGHRQIVSLDTLACQSCSAVCHAKDMPQAALILPLSLRGVTWGVLTFYGRDAGQFEAPQLPLHLAGIAGRLGASLESALQQEWLTLLDTALAGVDNAVFITNANAGILWANRSFTLLSGYSTEEILGRTPQLFRSGAQDSDFYRQFWQTISSGETWHGDIVNTRRDGSRYTAHQTVTPLLNSNGQVSHYVTILEDISERRAAEERMQHTAHFDLLTDLPNRGLFFDRLGQALALARREERSGALMFLDLDRFKQVNDQLGHAAGDTLLIAVAQRLRGEVRESDTVARLAGDEFTVILPNLRDEHDATRVADKILAAIAQPLVIAGREVTVGVSIGIAFFPKHGNTVEQIVNAADNAMYLAKKTGRNRYALASEETLIAITEAG